jgi:hypothetical protein
MGIWLTCLPRLTLAQLRMLRSTTGGTCYSDLEKFPLPRWENCRRACLDSRLHNCGRRFGQLQDVRAAAEIFPCPDGILTCFALVLSGRRCLHRRWHGDLVIMHHHWQHSYICACSRSKFPIAPMGKLLTSLPRLSLAQLRPTLRSTTGCTCRRDLQKIRSPRWENG